MKLLPAATSCQMDALLQDRGQRIWYMVAGLTTYAQFRNLNTVQFKKCKLMRIWLVLLVLKSLPIGFRLMDSSGFESQHYPLGRINLRSVKAELWTTEIGWERKKRCGASKWEREREWVTKCESERETDRRERESENERVRERDRQREKREIEKTQQQWVDNFC